jgi:hypothetical protein
MNALTCCSPTALDDECFDNKQNPTKRFRLWRTFGTGKTLGFLMLNPSIAGTTVKDDQTIKKCLGFAKANGYGGIEVVNLFPLVSTNQDGLARYDGSIDEEHNLEHIADTASRMKIVVAFGHIEKSDLQRKRALKVASSALDGLELLSIGVPTQSGYPFHPRNPGYVTPLLPFDLNKIL